MPNYYEYQKSISKEFKAVENRVRHLIDDAHWGEDGRYKEAILKNYLKRVIPQNLSVGTGFVRNGENITSQIDVIIYRNDLPLLFSDGDFIIAAPSNVVGIIEVKTNILSNQLDEIIKKANRNGSIIREGYGGFLFNGIFSYNGLNGSKYKKSIDAIDMISMTERQNMNQPYLEKLTCYVNNISIGEDTFIKLWPHEIDCDGNFYAEYALYRLVEGLGISYFLSNLQEHIIRSQSNNFSQNLDDHYKSMYYPIPEGKEIFKIHSVRKNY